MVARIIVGKEGDGSVLCGSGNGAKALTKACALHNPGEGVSDVWGRWKERQAGER